MSMPDEDSLDEAITQAWDELDKVEQKEGRTYSNEDQTAWVHKRSGEILDEWFKEEE